MKPIKAWAAIIVVGICVSQAVSTEQLFPQQLTQIIAEAVQNNPEILAVSEKTHAAALSISPASSWQEPILSFGLLNIPVDTWHFDQEPMTGKQIRVTQRFPFPGKTGLKEDVATANAEYYLHQQEEMVLDITARVKKIWFSLGYIQEALRQNQAMRELVRSINISARSSYQAGRIDLAGVLDMKQFDTQLYQQELEFQEQQKKMIAEMTYLLQRPFTMPSTGIDVQEIIEINLDADSLLRRAIQYRPAFRAWLARIEEHEKKVALARKGLFPDVTLGIAYTQRDELRNGGKGVDFLSGSVGLSLPLFAGNKQMPAIEAQKKELQAVKLTYAARKAQLRREINQELFAFEKNSKLLRMYQYQFLPQAQDAFSSSLVSYQNGQLGLQNLLLRQKQVLEYELAVTRFRTNVWLNWIELERLSGVPLDEAFPEGVDDED